MLAVYAGMAILAKIPIIIITSMSSIKVNPALRRGAMARVGAADLAGMAAVIAVAIVGEIVGEMGMSVLLIVNVRG